MSKLQRVLPVFGVLSLLTLATALPSARADRLFSGVIGTGDDTRSSTESKEEGTKSGLTPLLHWSSALPEESTSPRKRNALYSTRYEDKEDTSPSDDKYRTFYFDHRPRSGPIPGSAVFYKDAETDEPHMGIAHELSEKVKVLLVRVNRNRVVEIKDPFSVRAHPYPDDPETGMLVDGDLWRTQRLNSGSLFKRVRRVLADQGEDLGNVKTIQLVGFKLAEE